MLVTAELPAEFNGPVGYFDRWLWFALLAVLVVIAYYLATWWLTRERSEPADTAPPPPPAPDAQGRHLAAIDRIETEVRSGVLALRDGHQQLSETVRSYVDLTTHLPARTMSLADFKRTAPGQLADTIELMYPPEFAPGEEGRAGERFDIAVERARGLVSAWR
ncbi:hypothetical protein KUV85_17280 [Nocardioides panacisoli]|uniref:hypothetical protein n=1 Tax=Nocardioides panacisoli TaxID=627624 RepID=UPI001C629CD1|nr:hypothetical protein [Nocardioides panacisoli]QYJ04052.1 hypothetical protein KUV85_17280 [Nocardioides panacisoli]